MLSVVLGIIAFFVVNHFVLGEDAGCISTIILIFLLASMSYVIVRFLIAVIGYIIYVFLTPYVAIFFTVLAFAAMGVYIWFKDIADDLFSMSLVITKVQVGLIVASMLVSMIVCLVYGFRFV